MEESQILAKIKDIKTKMKPLGIRTEDDQIPQISWILLLKILDDFDLRREDEPDFKPIIPKPPKEQPNKHPVDAITWAVKLFSISGLCS